MDLRRALALSLFTLPLSVAALTGCGGSGSSGAEEKDSGAHDTGVVADGGGGADTTTPQDTGSDATMPQDSGVDSTLPPPDTGAPDTGPPVDSSPTDSSPPLDTGVSDTEAPDTATPPDSGARETGAAETGPADSGPADTGAPETGPADSGPADTGVADSAPTDTGISDTGVADGATESGTAEAGPEGGATFTIGGTLTGLDPNDTAQLSDGTSTVFVSANGAFQFPEALATGSTYTVTVLGNPSSPYAESCVVSNGSGTVGNANVTNVHVTCTSTGFTVGGTVTSLFGSTVVLQDNNGDTLTVNGNGTASQPFTFPTLVPSNSPYDVTILTQPTGQSCTVTGGSGTVTNQAVTSVAVSCSGPPLNGLVAYWNFEQTSPTVTDVSGNGNNGVNVGAVQGAGKVGQGYSFTNGECIGVPNSASLSMAGGAGLTMMAWGNYSGGCGPNDRGEILNKENTYEFATACASAGSTTNALQEAIQTNNGTGWFWTGMTTMTLGTWQLYAITWDGTTVLQYINGVQVGSRTLNGTFSATSTGLGIGCRGVAADGTTTSASSWWIGSIDEVTVYDRALTPAELTTYYTATK